MNEDHHPVGRPLGERGAAINTAELRKKAEEQLAPGSDAALAAGCRCAVLDNAHGLGYMSISDIFVTTESCPLHGLGSDWSRKALSGEKP